MTNPANPPAPSTPYPNLSAMHRSVAERLGPRVEIRYKRDGLYRDLGWTEARRQADNAASALIGLGVEPGDRVAILSENRHEWLIADLAILATGALDVPLHAPLSAQQVEYQLGHAEAKGVIVSGPAQADKVRAVAKSLPGLEFLVSFEPVEPIPTMNSLNWGALKLVGAKEGKEGLAHVLDREWAVGPDDLATIIYTSGTSGPPKGVMLTHGNLISNTEATLDAAPVAFGGSMICWLPYSHIYARTCDHYLLIMAGGIHCLADSVDTLVQNIAEIQPSTMSSVPRFYEKVWSTVEMLAPEARRERLRTIFGPNLQYLNSGGAPLPRHVGEGFAAAGIPLLEGYGQTECAPVISFNRFNACKVGTVGQALKGVEVKIADDGEILTRGPHVMKGYWKDAEATRAAIVDGWLHTGDVGCLDADGFLSITDRKKDLIITSGGKNIAPAELERLLVGDPYIDQAVAYGDARPFVSALIVPNFPALEAKAKHEGWPLTIVDGMIESQPIQAFMMERVNAVMEAVSNPERVKSILLLGRPFQLEDEELTATLKVRRRHILAKYQDRLDALYEDCRLS